MKVYDLLTGVAKEINISVKILTCALSPRYKLLRVSKNHTNAKATHSDTQPSFGIRVVKSV